MHALQAGAQQLIPVGEIDVDGGAGHTGFGGDVVHGDVGCAALAEQAPGHGDDLVAPKVPNDLPEVLGRLPGGHQEAMVAAGGKATGRCLTPQMN